MADDAEELERKINVIRGSFAGKLAGRLLDIKQAAKDLRQAETPAAAETARKTLNLIAHSLAGSAATFGFPEISQVAAKIEAATEPEQISSDDLAGLIKNLEDSIQIALA